MVFGFERESAVETLRFSVFQCKFYEWQAVQKLNTCFSLSLSLSLSLTFSLSLFVEGAAIIDLEFVIHYCRVFIFEHVLGLSFSVAVKLCLGAKLTENTI